MSSKFTKPVLAVSLLVSLVAMSATANASATISDKRYWPSEVGPSAYRAVSTHRTTRDAFAAIDQISEPAGPRYLGGPKSGLAVFTNTSPAGQ